jgi:HSP20 family protein
MKFGLTKRNEGISSELYVLRRRISNVFDDYFCLEPSCLFDNDWSPALEVKEDDREIHIRADLPGLEEKDISVTFRENVLTISGERKEEKESKAEDGRSIISERSYGAFSRTISLPAEIDADKISAKYKNGVLKLTVPKSRAEKPKKIAIDVK